MSKTASRRGFTLPELLIVLGVVLLLLAILLPALGAIREGARQTACSNNLRQHCTIMQTYANDNAFWIQRDWAPGMPLESSWKLSTAKYAGLWGGGEDAAAFEKGEKVLKENSLFNCQSHPLDGQIPGSYVINAFRFETAVVSEAQGAGPITRVQNPSEVVWLAEIADRFDFPTYAGVNGIYLLEFHDVFSASQLPGRKHPRITDDRHDGDANFAFFDGSVRVISAGDVSLRMFDDGTR